MSIDQEYKDFSKWCRDNPAYDLDPRLHTHSGRINDGGYISHKRTGTAFKAWQASRQGLEGESVALSSNEMSGAFKSAWQNGMPLDSVEAIWCWVGWQQAMAVSVPEAEYTRALQDAFDIIQADANSERNYGSLCRIGSVLAKIKAGQEKSQ